MCRSQVYDISTHTPTNYKFSLWGIMNFNDPKTFNFFVEYNSKKVDLSFSGIAELGFN